MELCAYTMVDTIGATLARLGFVEAAEATELRVVRRSCVHIYLGYPIQILDKVSTLTVTRGPMRDVRSLRDVVPSVAEFSTKPSS